MPLSFTRSNAPGQTLLTNQQMNERIVLFIVGFYLFLNPTNWNLVNFFRSAIQAATQSESAVLFYLILGTIALGLFAFMARRVNLAIKDTNKFLLAIYTLVLALAVGTFCYALVSFGWVEYRGFETIWRFITWTWQIVIGFALGQGMNWNIQERRLAGIQGTQEVNAHGNDHHNDGGAQQ